MSSRRDHHWPTHKANAQRRARLTRLYRHRAALAAMTMRGKRRRNRMWIRIGYALDYACDYALVTR